MLLKFRIYLLIPLWLTIAMVIGIKIFLTPAIPWIATACLVLLFPGVAMARASWRQMRPESRRSAVMFGASLALFAACILLTDSAVGQWDVGLKYGVKYALLLGAFGVLLAAQVRGEVMIRALVVLLVVNLVALVLCIALYVGMQLLPDGRIGSLVNPPGVLWKIGGYTFIYFAYRLLAGGGIRAFVLTVLCLLTVGLDGSRSAFLIALVGYGLMFGWYVIGHRQLPSVRQGLLVLLTVPLGFWLMPVGVKASLNFFYHATQVEAQGNVAEHRILALAKVMPMHRHMGAHTPRLAAQGLAPSQNDVTRKEMFLRAIHRIQQHPLWGGGTGSTAVATAAGAMYVHMTYLQIWGDYGLPALLCYLAALGAFVYAARAYVAAWRAGKVQRPEEGLLCVFILLGYGLYGLFNPLSNEPSEWALYLLALAVLITETDGAYA